MSRDIFMYTYVDQGTSYVPVGQATQDLEYRRGKSTRVVVK